MLCVMVIWESIICFGYLLLTVNLAVILIALFNSYLSVVMCIYIFILFFSSIYLNSSWVELHASRGHESYDHKIFMRNAGKLLIVIFVILCLFSLFWLLLVVKMLYVMGKIHLFLSFPAVGSCIGVINAVSFFGWSAQSQV